MIYLEVYSTELTCKRKDTGRIVIESSTPLQNQPVLVNDQVAYFNGDQVITDESGMATLQFNKPGIKNIVAGIDEMVVSVRQLSSFVSISGKKSVKIWPQPATEYVNVSVNNQIISSLKIFDTSNRLVLVKNDIDEEYYSLKTDNIKQGIYILQITTDRGISNHKILFK